MPINNITQTISTLPPAGRRGVDVQTLFVTKQEDFQDHLQGTTVTELNTLKAQLNARIGEINSTTTTMNGYADTASAGASTATTKAGEASTSASEALTSRNQASTSATNSSNSATKASQWANNNYNVEVETGKYSAKHWSVVAENVVAGTVKLTGNETIAGVKTFSSSPIVPTPTTNTQVANKEYVDSTFGVAWSANDTRAKTALNATGTAPIYACRAWVNFNGWGTTVAIRASGNVSSIADNGVGDYTVNFTTAMPDANYSITAMTSGAGSLTSSEITTLDTASSRVKSTIESNGGTTPVDLVTICITINR